MSADCLALYTLNIAKAIAYKLRLDTFNSHRFPINLVEFFWHLMWHRTKKSMHMKKECTKERL